MNQPPLPQRSEHKEIQRLLNEVKLVLAESRREGKKLEWEIDEFLRVMNDLKNVMFLLREGGPELNYKVHTEANDPNRDLHRYWNSMRDGYGGI